MKLFLSHATEDKDFVRQLADRLESEAFEVWLDERKMTLGDSILGKINEGLLAADYGVVVLSPTFFRKKWTRTELGALMALETSTKKMILPIWKDLSSDEIAHLMPTLSDRLAVNASAGLDVVVQAIKSAVGGAEHQRNFSKFDQLKARLDKMSATSKARRTADILLNSHDGATRVAAEFARLGDLLESYFNKLSSDELRFSVNRNEASTVDVQAPHRYGAQIHFSEGAYNTGAHASLGCLFYRIGKPRDFGGRDEPQTLTKQIFYPYFSDAGTVVWSASEKREEVMNTDTFIAVLAEKLTDYIANARR